MRNTTSRSRIALTSAAFAALIGLTACGGGSDTESVLVRGVEIDPAADTSADDGVLLLTAGAVDRITLPVAYGVGDSAESTLALDINIGVSGRSEKGGMVIDMTQEITEVVDDIATVEMVISDVDAPGSDAAAEAVTAEFEDIIGVPLLAEVDPTGLPTGAIRRADGGTVPASLGEQMAQVSSDFEFPSEPVGVGAVWTAEVEIEQNGITIETETRFDLVELTADRYVVEITQRVPIDEKIDGTRIEGLLEGTGRLSVDRNNPLDVNMEYEQSGSYSAEGLTISLDIAMTLDSE